MGNMDSHTVMFGVFGDPVKHSRSPIMLNRAFIESGINGAYAAFHITPDKLKDAVYGIKALQFRGVNVTIPHKEEVMQYLDEIDETAREMGAVNTIVNDDGRLIGYNTDGIGYVRSLKEETGMKLAGAHILMIGAGGAARGIAYAFAKEGVASIRIANRTKARAVELAEYISRYTESSGMGLDEIAHSMNDVSLVVNTSPAGMYPNIDELPMDPSLINKGTVVSEIIYNPPITRFLREAEARGAIIHNGLGMFIYQGAYAFEYWTGLPAPAAAMRQAVEQSFQT